MRRTRNPRTIANRISAARVAMNRAQRFGRQPGTTAMVPDEATLPNQRTIIESKTSEGPFIVWRIVSDANVFYAGTRTLERAVHLATTMFPAVVTDQHKAIVFDTRKGR